MSGIITEEPTESVTLKGTNGKKIDFFVSRESIQHVGFGDKLVMTTEA